MGQENIALQIFALLDGILALLGFAGPHALTVYRCSSSPVRTSRRPCFRETRAVWCRGRRIRAQVRGGGRGKPVELFLQPVGRCSSTFLHRHYHQGGDMG